MATARVMNPLNRFIDFETGRWNACSHSALSICYAQDKGGRHGIAYYAAYFE